MLQSTSTDQGVSRTFPIPSTEARRLALESLQGLNIDIKSTNEQGSDYLISFAKPASAFSWGEVGKAVVRGDDKSSTVTIITAKRMQVQITGTSQDEFATAVFEGIEYAINRR